MWWLVPKVEIVVVVGIRVSTKDGKSGTEILNHRVPGGNYPENSRQRGSTIARFYNSKVLIV